MSRHDMRRQAVPFPVCNLSFPHTTGSPASDTCWGVISINCLNFEWLWHDATLTYSRYNPGLAGLVWFYGSKGGFIRWFLCSPISNHSTFMNYNLFGHAILPRWDTKFVASLSSLNYSVPVVLGTPKLDIPHLWADSEILGKNDICWEAEMNLARIR